MKKHLYDLTKEEQEKAKEEFEAKLEEEQKKNWIALNRSKELSKKTTLR